MPPLLQRGTVIALCLQRRFRGGAVEWLTAQRIGKSSYRAPKRLTTFGETAPVLAQPFTQLGTVFGFEHRNDGAETHRAQAREPAISAPLRADNQKSGNRAHGQQVERQ